MHILLIEDDLDLGRALHQALKAEGISCEWRRRVMDAPTKAELDSFDCVLLDLTLPDGSGFELLARWRQGGALTPLIVITARSGLEDRLQGLDGGADDFIIKPFAMPELMSRLRAVQRRYSQQASQVWRCGALELLPRGSVARLDGVLLDLSPREFSLLLELARQPGQVVPKDLLAQRMAPLGEALDFTVLEVHVSNVRKKIGAGRIKTLRGVGYMLVAA